jgi:hypothetical protein
MPNTTGNITPPIRLRMNVSGSVAYHYSAGYTGSTSTFQYQDILNVPQFGLHTTPGGKPTGTPEFAMPSGSING